MEKIQEEKWKMVVYRDDTGEEGELSGCKWCCSDWSY